jgi:hypothetical protein
MSDTQPAVCDHEGVTGDIPGLGEVKSYKHTVLRSGILGSDEVQFGRHVPNYYLLLSTFTFKSEPAGS